MKKVDYGSRIVQISTNDTIMDMLEKHIQSNFIKNLHEVMKNLLDESESVLEKDHLHKEKRPLIIMESVVGILKQINVQIDRRLRTEQ